MKNYIILILKLLSISIAVAEYKPNETIVYKSVKNIELKLDIFTPKKTNIKNTAIVYFHGGGWKSGTTRQFHQTGRKMADLGFVAISAEYRLFSKHKASPFLCVEDAKSAIRWVRKNAQKYNLNPDLIIASGGSAGGHLAICTSLIEGYDAKDEDLSISSSPNLVIAYNPVLDTTEAGFGSNNFEPNEVTLLSPCHQIKTDLPPMLVIHGDQDETVPYENAKRFVKLMKEAKNQCELITYTGRGHGFFNSPHFRKNLDGKDYQQSFTESLEFIVKHNFADSKILELTTPK